MRHKPKGRLELLIARAVAALYFRNGKPVMLLRNHRTVVLTTDVRWAEKCPDDVIGTFAGSGIEQSVAAALDPEFDRAPA